MAAQSMQAEQQSELLSLVPNGDAELRAIRAILRAIDGLGNAQAQRRVMRYVNDRVEAGLVLSEPAKDEAA